MHAQETDSHIQPLSAIIKPMRVPAELQAQTNSKIDPAAGRQAIVELLRQHIEAHFDRPLPLSELGRIAHCSPFTAQRLFRQQMGISPLGYQRALKAGRMREFLKQGASVTEALYSAGFSSPSRAYAGSALGMSPLRFARGGAGEHIGWASASTCYGSIIAAETTLGLCWLSLAGSAGEALSQLRNEFPCAILREDPNVAHWIDQALRLVEEPSASLRQSEAENIDLRGTEFQLRVWNALRQIPRGQRMSYSELARSLGQPTATRAVARACATNRVALLVPCHRIVGATGSLTGYRWGIERKRLLLEAEAKKA